MNLTGTPEDILAALTATYPEIPRVLSHAQSTIPHKKRQIAPYQGAALYAAARPYNRHGASILEIGTFLGYSAAIIAQACPMASIVTLNPNPEEAVQARVNLQKYGNVTVRPIPSWDLLDRHAKRNLPPYSLIFVDGDHKNILKDLPWFDYIRPGGLFLHHDYAPEGTYRACPPVYEALNNMSRALGRDFDVEIVDAGGVGMAGFIRQADDAGWQERMP